MKVMRTTMPDGSQYDVPVEVIARNRAAYYAHEYDGDIERSLAEDTMPLFESDAFEIEDWAQNNMNWTDPEVLRTAHRVTQAHVDYQEGWVNGEKKILEVPDL